MQESETRRARFNEIYEQHFEVVRRYVWRRDPLIADDVSAETFLVAWRRLVGHWLHVTIWIEILKQVRYGAFLSDNSIDRPLPPLN